MSRNIYDLKVKELEELLELSKDYPDIETFRSTIENIKKVKEKENGKLLNERFTIEMLDSFGSFSPYELEILEKYNIKNIEDLLNTDLESIDISNDIKRKFEWIRNTYNSNNLEGDEIAKRR